MEGIFSFVGGETVNCSLSILGTYCKGAVPKNGDKTFQCLLCAKDQLYLFSIQTLLLSVYLDLVTHVVVGTYLGLLRLALQYY